VAEQLGLKEEQKKRTEEAYHKMHEDAVRLGKQIVEAEKKLDMSFSECVIDESSLQELVMQIGEWQGRLRFVHLKSHLKMIDLLSPEQIQQYDMLRGYRRHQPKMHYLH
jgi:Spy/CpxP family protein refolding chaperone